MYIGHIYIYIQLAEMRFGFPSDANRRVGNLFRFRTKWSFYTRTSRCCETVTCNCVLKRSETLLFKGRYRHSFREIDNPTKLHNTYNLSPPRRADELMVVRCVYGYWRVERGLRKGFVRKIIIRMRNKNKTFLYAYSFVRVNVRSIIYL